MTPVRVRIAFDLVCPWCFIGEQRFTRAVTDRSDLVPTVERLPFLLHPEVTRSVPRDELLAKKFGSPRIVQSMFDRLEKIGRDLDIPFDFNAMQVVPDTVPAHALLGWAAGAGLGSATLARLYGAYFCEGRDIGDPEVLSDIARQAGMDPDTVRKRLAEQRDFGAVREAARLVRRAGITSVPFFVFADRVAIQGAQPESVFARALEQVGGAPPAPLRVAANWN